MQIPKSLLSPSKDKIVIGTGIHIEIHKPLGDTTVLYTITGINQMKVIVQLLSRCTDEQAYNKQVQALRSLSVSITATCTDIKQLADFLNCNMVYFLTSTDIFSPAIYVGRAGKRTETGETFLERLKEHVNLTTNRDKEMEGQWDKIQFIVQSDDDISKDVMERLEAIFIAEAYKNRPHA